MDGKILGRAGGASRTTKYGFTTDSSCGTEAGCPAMRLDHECLQCGSSRWTFDGFNRRPSKTVATFECVHCGNPFERRVDARSIGGDQA